MYIWYIQDMACTFIKHREMKRKPATIWYHSKNSVSVHQVGGPNLGVSFIFTSVVGKTKRSSASLKQVND